MTGSLTKESLIVKMLVEAFYKLLALWFENLRRFVDSSNQDGDEDGKMFTRRRPAVGAGAFYFARTIAVDAVRSERRETALHVAAKTGHVRTCAVLIRQV